MAAILFFPVHDREHKEFWSLFLTGSTFVEEKVDVIHRGRCNNKVYYRLSHDVVTLDVDRCKKAWQADL